MAPSADKPLEKVPGIADVTAEGLLRAAFVHDLSGLQDSAEALPESAQHHVVQLATSIPGVMFQRILDQENRVGFTFLRGRNISDLGLDAVAVQKDPDLFMQRMHPDDRDDYRRQLERSAKELRPMDMVVRLQDDQGRMHFIRSVSHPRVLDDGSVAWDGIAFDITTERLAQQSLHHASLHDSLTDLPNLVAFRQRVDASSVTRILPTGSSKPWMPVDSAGT